MKSFIISAIIAATSVDVSTASAQDITCSERPMLVAALSERYGEELRSAGMGSSHYIIETFANLITGTFTVLVTKADGTSCVVSAGRAYHESMNTTETY